MKAVRNSRNRRRGGLIIALLGVIGVLYFGAAAREAALDGAVHQASVDLAPRLGAQATGDPQVVVHRLVTTNASAMAFLTVRNGNRQLVASDGAWSGWFEGMASRATVRAWRAWMYRMLCAETYRPIANGAGLHAGVPWWHVVASAGPAFWLAGLLFILGLAIAERERRTQGAELTAGPASSSRHEFSPAIWHGSLQRLRRAIQRDAAPHAPTRGFQPIGQRRAPREDSAAPLGPAQPRHDNLAVTTVTEPPDHDHEVVAPDTQAMPDSADVDKMSASSSSDPFLLRFQPIWRGALDGLLAGAAVGFVRADAPDARLLTLDDLMAAGVGQSATPETLVRWLTRRLATLQANWRTLELPRVPLMVPLPTSLLLFERAGEVWADALSRHEEPAPGDLVFCVERMPDMAGPALPVRWAMADTSGPDRQRWYCLKPGTFDDPFELDADNALSSTGADESCFVLPACGEPAMDDAHRVLSPRAFARLMSRSELAPF